MSGGFCPRVLRSWGLIIGSLYPGGLPYGALVWGLTLGGLRPGGLRPKELILWTYVRGRAYVQIKICWGLCPGFML